MQRRLLIYWRGTPREPCQQPTPNRRSFLATSAAAVIASSADIKRRDRGRRGDAVRVKVALAIELLTVAPMRIRNLAGLALERPGARAKRNRTTNVKRRVP